MNASRRQNLVEGNSKQEYRTPIQSSDTLLSLF
jgi:hypothetical protein